ncbi:MAG: portal protein [Acidiferrobacteraceae bacterium]
MADNTPTSVSRGPTQQERDFRRFGELRQFRFNWDWLWQRVSDYVIPRRGDFTVTRYPGQRRDYEIYDTTATWALNQLAAGLHTLLTTPALPWFYLTVRNGNLVDNQAVQVWLSEIQARINAVFNDPGSRFQSQIHEVYTDLGAFGSAVLDVQSTPKGVRFANRFLGECYFAQTATGEVDTLYRAFVLPYHRIVETFGEDKLPPEMQKAGGKDQFHTFKLLHATYPDQNAKKWESRYYTVDYPTLIKEGQFKQFPYITPRWAQSHVETYGRGPAIEALGDILMVNEMKRTLLRYAHKATDPPLLLPDSGFMQAINLNAGGQNYYDASSPGEIKYLESHGAFPVGEAMLSMTQQDIIRAFFVDMLQLPGGLMPGAKNQNTYMTATEATIRRENAMRVMGPQVSRLQNELLSPLISKVFAILLQKRALPPPPDTLLGADLDIVYVSPLSIAQAGAEVDNWARFMAQMTPLASLDPTIMDSVNTEAVAPFLATKYHVPAALVRTQAQVQAIQQQRQQAAQAQQASIAENTNLVAAKRNMVYANTVQKVAGQNQAQ